MTPRQELFASVTRAVCQASRPGWECGYPGCACDTSGEKEATAAIKALRDLPHTILDAARGSRMASGDAAVFWNNVIDLLLPLDGGGEDTGGQG